MGAGVEMASILTVQEELKQEGKWEVSVVLHLHSFLSCFQRERQERLTATEKNCCCDSPEAL